MENKSPSDLNRSLNLDHPDGDTMDEQLDTIIPLVRPWGEDLYEQEYYLDTRWLEIRDDDEFHESVLHIFREESEYLISIDGNITAGAWKILDRSNTFIIERQVGGSVITSELFDLAFLNKDFFILRKHGDQRRKGSKKYFVLARESSVRGLEWRDVMELLYNLQRTNTRYIASMVLLVVFVLAVLAYSFLYR